MNEEAQKINEANEFVESYRVFFFFFFFFFEKKFLLLSPRQKKYFWATE